jgi:hypothetical protein
MLFLLLTQREGLLELSVHRQEWEEQTVSKASLCEMAWRGDSCGVVWLEELEGARMSAALQSAATTRAAT